VALGGLIRDRTEEREAGLPLLSQIPILGNLFKTTADRSTRTELLVLLTPRVVRNQTEAREVTDELRRRLSNVVPLELEIQ
jgi:general secretion pathway protein D